MSLVNREHNRWLFDQFFRALNTGLPPQVSGVFPQVNIYDDGENYLIRAEIPGVDQPLEVEARKNQVTIRGSRKVESAESGANYHRRERESGQFRRVVTVEDAIDTEKAKSKYTDGILEITLPRANESKTRRIEVKS